MDPILELDDKQFILLDVIYERSRNFLVQFVKTNIMYPRVCIHHNYVSFEWLTCAVHIYKDEAILISEHGENKYILPEQTVVVLLGLKALVPFRRSRPISIN